MPALRQIMAVTAAAAVVSMYSLAEIKQQSACVGSSSVRLHYYEDSSASDGAASVVFKNVIVRAGTVYICGNEISSAKALDIVCTWKMGTSPVSVAAPAPIVHEVVRCCSLVSDLTSGYAEFMVVGLIHLRMVYSRVQN